MARPKQISDEEILAHARDLFIEFGAGVSTTVIAARCGVSQAALFKRFGTKDELMILSLAPKPTELVEWLEAGPDERPMVEQLKDLGTRASRFMAHSGPAMNVLMSCHLTKKDVFSHFQVPPPVLVHRALAGWFDRSIEAGLMRRVDTAKLALALMGAVRTHVMLRSVIGGSIQAPAFPFDTESFAPDVLEMLWTGLQPEEAS